MKYAGYGTDDLKQQLKRMHATINNNRREKARLLHKIDELTEAVKSNNQVKKALKREIKRRIIDERSC